MIWDEFSFFRTNCARRLRREFFGYSAGEMAFKIPGTFDIFGSLNTFMSVGILLKYFSRNVLQFQRSKTVPNLGTRPALYH